MALLRNMQFFIENYNDCKSPTKAFNYSQQFFLAIQSVNKKWLHDIYLLFLFLCIIGRHFFFLCYLFLTIPLSKLLVAAPPSFAFLLARWTSCSWLCISSLEFARGTSEKEEETRGFEPSTLGVVRLFTWRISPPDHGAPSRHFYEF